MENKSEICSAILPIVVAIDSSTEEAASSEWKELCSLLEEIDGAFDDIRVMTYAVSFSDEPASISDGFIDACELKNKKIVWKNEKKSSIVPLIRHIEKVLNELEGEQRSEFLYPAITLFVCSSIPDDAEEFSRRFKDITQSMTFGVDEDSSAVAKSGRAVIRAVDLPKEDIELRKAFGSYCDSLTGGDKDMVFSYSNISKLKNFIVPFRPSAEKLCEEYAPLDEVFFGEADDEEPFGEYVVETLNSLVSFDGDEFEICARQIAPCLPSEEMIPCFLLRRESGGARIALTNLSVSDATMELRLKNTKKLKRYPDDVIECEFGEISVTDDFFEVSNPFPYASTRLVKSFNVGETVEVGEYDRVYVNGRKLIEIQLFADDIF